MRDELAEAAVKMLARRGYEETTVDQIVAAAGVSRRTFFRYFQSKDDVVVHFLANAGAQLCAELQSRPVGEPSAVALRHALTPFVQLSVDRPDETLHLSKLMLDTPAVLGRFLERLTRWQADIADILAERSGLDPRADLRPTLTAGVALTAFQTAFRRWTDGNGTEHLSTIVDEAFAVIAPALDQARTTN